jgi:hypothetical protein
MRGTLIKTEAVAIYPIRQSRTLVLVWSRGRPDPALFLGGWSVMVRGNEVTSPNSSIDGGDYCLFVDGGWCCAGKSCNNPTHVTLKDDVTQGSLDRSSLAIAGFDTHQTSAHSPVM